MKDNMEIVFIAFNSNKICYFSSSNSNSKTGSQKKSLRQTTNKQLISIAFVSKKF